MHYWCIDRLSAQDLGLPFVEAIETTARQDAAAGTLRKHCFGYAIGQCPAMVNGMWVRLEKLDLEGICSLHDDVHVRERRALNECRPDGGDENQESNRNKHGGSIQLPPFWGLGASASQDGHLRLLFVPDSSQGALREGAGEQFYLFPGSSVSAQRGMSARNMPKIGVVGLRKPINLLDSGCSSKARDASGF